MPEMDGLEATRAIRPPCRDGKSGRSSDDRQRLRRRPSPPCEDAGMNDFVDKPRRGGPSRGHCCNGSKPGLSRRHPRRLCPPARSHAAASRCGERPRRSSRHRHVGLRYIAGNKVRYRKVLRKFKAQYGPEFIAEFRRLRREQRLVDRVAHGAYAKKRSPLDRRGRSRRHGRTTGTCRGGSDYRSPSSGRCS